MKARLVQQAVFLIKDFCSPLGLLSFGERSDPLWLLWRASDSFGPRFCRLFDGAVTVIRQLWGGKLSEERFAIWPIRRTKETLGFVGELSTGRRHIELSVNFLC